MQEPAKYYFTVLSGIIVSHLIRLLLQYKKALSDHGKKYLWDTASREE